MESSHFIGGAEECDSCESGWTMYLASPMHHDDCDYDGDDYDHGSGDDSDSDDGRVQDHSDSDDSMASDASSGPSHPDHFYDGCHEIDNSMNDDSDDKDDEEDDAECGGECSEYSYKRSYRRRVKSREIGDKKEKPFHLGQQNGFVTSSCNVRKNNYMRKGN